MIVVMVITCWLTSGAALGLAFDRLVMARRFRSPSTRRELTNAAALSALLGPIALVPIGCSWWICAGQQREHDRRMAEMAESHERRMAEIKDGTATGIWPPVWY